MLCGTCKGRGRTQRHGVPESICPACGGSGQSRAKPSRVPTKKLEAPDPDALDTLGIARVKLREQLDDGVICPCCGQRAQRYKRKLNSGMAHALIEFHKRHGDEWFHLEETQRQMIVDDPDVPRSGDACKLRWWELLEKHDEDAGHYRVTPKGRRFALGHIRVPRHCFIYNDTRDGFSDESSDIRDALGDHFDYDKLMSGDGG